jgi:hypothetical protein
MLVTVGRYLDPWEAYVLRGRLEAEGIPAVVSNDGLATTNWPWSYALGGVQLQVPASDVDAALSLLKDYASGVLEQDLVAQEGLTTERCAKCGSDDIRAKVPASQRLLVLLTFAWAVTFPTHASRRACGACGATWQPD